MVGGAWQPLGPGLSPHSCSLCPPACEPLPHPLCCPVAILEAAALAHQLPPQPRTQDNFFQQWLPSFAQLLLPGAANQALGLLL